MFSSTPPAHDHGAQHTDCIEVYVYLLVALLVHIWSTVEQLHFQVCECFCTYL